jgi:hypothetical protein
MKARYAEEPQTLTPWQARAELTDMRYPATTTTPAEARAELTRLALPPFETAESVGLHG